MLKLNAADGVTQVLPHGTGEEISAATITARLSRLPMTRSMWTLVLLLSLGGWFEIYDMFFTAYVGPGMVKSGLFSNTTASFFGFTGLGGFVAATFAGLFLGTFFLGLLSDRFGRRFIFTAALLWYTVAAVIMAFQHTALEVNIWRLIAGIGVGAELVTIIPMSQSWCRQNARPCLRLSTDDPIYSYSNDRVPGLAAVARDTVWFCRMALDHAEQCCRRYCYMGDPAWPAREPALAGRSGPAGGSRCHRQRYGGEGPFGERQAIARAGR